MRAYLLRENGHHTYNERSSNPSSPMREIKRDKKENSLINLIILRPNLLS